jgi:hypothetical protein
MASQTEPIATLTAPAEPLKSPVKETEIMTDKVYKPSDVYADKASTLMGSGSHTSLNRLMSARTSFGSVRSAFALDINRRQQQQKQNATFDAYGYGYGYGADEEDKAKTASTEECPAQKRRRFQRRNSKTPAMLMAMNSPLLLHLDFLEDKKEHAKTTAAANTTATAASATGTASPLPSTTAASSSVAFDAKKALDIWDGGLEIAEELVMHLQKRRKSNS